MNKNLVLRHNNVVMKSQIRRFVKAMLFVTSLTLGLGSIANATAVSTHTGVSPNTTCVKVHNGDGSCSIVCEDGTVYKVIC